MKILDSFIMYYDLSEQDKMKSDIKFLRTKGWNSEVNEFFGNDELKGFYVLLSTEIDGFVYDDLAERITKYIFGEENVK